MSFNLKDTTKEDDITIIHDDKSVDDDDDDYDHHVLTNKEEIKNTQIQVGRVRQFIDLDMIVIY